MDNETEPTPEEREAEEAARVEAAQQRLQADLLSSTNSPEAAPISLPRSETQMADLLGTLVLRVDQLAKVAEEQYGRQERVNQETEKTMQLAREMIAQLAQQYELLNEQIDRTETAAEALVRVNANLTEIVAALVGPQPQKG